MARLSERLSAKRVELATAPGMYPDGHGLYLRIGPTGAKSWVFRYRNSGRRHDLGLGPYHLISLAEARKRASDQRRLLRIDGCDPLLARRTERDQARLSGGPGCGSFETLNLEIGRAELPLGMERHVRDF